MPLQKKVYDYKPEVVERRILTTLRNRNRESTVADIIADTGLPKYQIQEMMNLVVRDYAGHLRVTESGELLYYFPEGFRNRRTGFLPRFKRFLNRAATVIGKVLTVLFKIWIMVMLIGYFVLFIALLLLAMLASVAGSMNSRDSGRGGRDRMGGFGSFMLTARVIELFATLWLYSGSPGTYGSVISGRKRQRPKGRPLHQSVFAFVFGDDTAYRQWSEKEKKEFIKLVQSQKGVVTLEEIMHLTGKSREAAEELVNEYLVEFEGEPDVIESGLLIFRFPELMRTKELSAAGTSFQRQFIPLIPFNKNKASVNKWVGFFNGFNLVFGAYFLIYSYAVHVTPLSIQQHLLDRFYHFVTMLVAQISANPIGLIGIALGVVPVVFSVLFYAVPLFRRLRERTLNQQIKQSNLRKRTVANVLAGPDFVDPEEIVPQLPEETPDGWPQFVVRAVQDVAGSRSVDVEEKKAAADGHPASYVYRIPDLKRELSELQKYRTAIQLSEYAVGDTIFDSGDSEPQ